MQYKSLRNIVTFFLLYAETELICSLHLLHYHCFLFYFLSKRVFYFSPYVYTHTSLLPAFSSLLLSFLLFYFRF